MNDLVARFTHLFRGRMDAHGSWDGGSVKGAPDWEAHLCGPDPEHWIGVYPLGGDKCSWGCIDIDGGDFPFAEMNHHPDYNRKDPQWHDWEAMYELAENLVTVLAVKGVDGHIERTRNGYHVWVFPEDLLVLGKTMRRALMAACTAIGYKPNEVNPKQESLEGDKLGNYVRLPYPGALHGGFEFTPERAFVFEGEPLTIHEFIDWATPTATSNLEACAALWTPKAIVHSVDLTAGLEAEPTVRKLNALGYTIWRDGPLPGSDRSSTLAHLSHICNESNLTADEAFVVVRSADERHGRKFAEREDGDERIAEMIERAFAT